MPEGIDTVVGERGRQLSAGERQRLAIARVLLADPSVLVMDEATGSLDPRTEALVIRAYDRLLRGRTTILITHRRELAHRADRVVVIERGRVAEDGAPEHLEATGTAFRGLFHDAIA